MATSLLQQLCSRPIEMKIPTREVELVEPLPSHRRTPLLQRTSLKEVPHAEEEADSTVAQAEPVEQEKAGKGKKGGKEKEKKFSWPIWRKLFEYTMRRKFLAILGLVLSVCFAMSVSLLPLKVGKVLDYITTASEFDTTKNVTDLRESVTGLVYLVGCLALFTFLRFLSLQFLQQFLAMDMRNDFYRRFMSNDLYFFEQYKSGQLVSRLSSDVNQAKSAVSNNLTYLIRSVVIICSNIIILFTISWKLTSLVMLLVPIYSAITLQYSKRNKVLVKQYQDVQAEISATVAEKFGGIQLVKACSTEEREIAEYEVVITKGYHINRKKIFYTGIYNSCSEFLPYIGILIVLWYGGEMVIEGQSELTAGELTSFIMYCTTLANSTSAISSSYTNIINGTYAVQKVFAMLDYQPLCQEAKGSNAVISGAVELDNVTFRYPTSKTAVLREVSLKIERGEYIAFVGESGSGKSTIVKLIEKFYQIESGRILFDHHDQQDINATCLRRQIGLVNQDATMFSGSIRDNITYGLTDFSIPDLENAAERAGCMEFLRNQKQFPKGFETEVGEKGGHLSGGQRQRISIARALMRRPKIIIFDEATSALDSNSEQMVQNSIEDLARKDGSQRPTIIVIAHRLSTVINADRIYVMKNGQIVETGSHKELRAQGGYYYQLIQKQLGDHPELISPSRDKQ